MDESEKRRDRLKAMRMEAAQVEVSNDVETSVVSSSLSNPLIEPSATLSVQEESCATPRFDFYTDPMSAFSANKKRSKDGNHNIQDYYTPPSYSGSPMARISSSLPGSMNPELTPSSAYQLQSNYSHERIYQPQGPYNNAAPHGSPRGMASPFPMHQGTPEAWNGSGHTTGYYSSVPHSSHMANPFPMQQGTPEALNRSGSYSFPSNPSIGANIPSPGFRPMGSPRFNYGQGRANWLGNSPSPGSGYLGSPGPGSGYRGSHGPGSGYPGSPGRGSGYRGSPGPGSGRGRGRWYSGNMSPGSGRGGGRGAGFHNRDSGQRLGPECFFDKSMVEDPWQHLEPILWKGLHDSVNSLKSPGSSNSWLPKSISMKKARVSEASNNSSPQPSLAKHLADASNKSSPQPSLAEYLAASFNEAINDTPSA